MILNTFKKLVIWHAGTGESESDVYKNTAALRKPHKETAVTVIDGISSSENRKAVDHLSGNSIAQNNNLLQRVAKTQDFLEGYTEEHHLSSINKAFEAISEHITSPEQESRQQRKKPKKTNLIIGGFSRGASVAMTGLLAAMSQEMLMKGIGQDNMFSRGLINKVSLIPVDPVAGIGKHQDFFGVDTSKKNPLKEVLAPIATKVPVDIALLTARTEGLTGLESHDIWRQLIQDPPKGVTIRPEMTAGLGHVAMTTQEHNGLYTPGSREQGFYTPLDKNQEQIEISPNGLLNAVILEKLGILKPQEVFEIYDQVHHIDSKLLAMAIENKGAAQQIRKQLGMRNYLDFPGAQTIGVITKQSIDVTANIKKHKTQESLEVNGRDIDIKGIQQEREQLQKTKPDLSQLTKPSIQPSKKIPNSKKSKLKQQKRNTPKL